MGCIFLFKSWVLTSGNYTIVIKIEIKTLIATHIQGGLHQHHNFFSTTHLFIISTNFFFLVFHTCNPSGDISKALLSISIQPSFTSLVSLLYTYLLDAQINAPKLRVDMTKRKP